MFTLHQDDIISSWSFTRWCFFSICFMFTPIIWGRWTQFDVRIFFRWVGSTTNEFEVNGGFQPKAFHFPPTRRLLTRDFSAYASGAKGCNRKEGVVGVAGEGGVHVFFFRGFHRFYLQYLFWYVVVCGLLFGKWASLRENYSFKISDMPVGRWRFIALDSRSQQKLHPAHPGRHWHLW